MSEENIMTLPKKSFLNLSVVLTGFNEVELLSTGQFDIYFKEFSSMYPTSNEGEEFKFPSLKLNDEKYKKIYDGIINNNSKESKSEPAKNIYIDIDKLKNQISNAYGKEGKEVDDLIKRTIKLWYIGVWVDQEYADVNSYAEGLIWKTFHTHAPGHKQPGFGSWSIKPLTVK